MTIHFLHDTVPFLMNRISAQISASANTEFRKFGLNLLSARVLVVLLVNKSATVGELAEATSIDPSTLSHILRRLSRQGLVTKERQAHDNRSVLVKLTPKGKRLAEKCLDAVADHERAITRGVDPERIRQLKATLQVLYANVAAFGGEDSASPR